MGLDKVFSKWTVSPCFMTSWYGQNCLWLWLSKVWYICFRVLFFFFQCTLSLWMCFIFLQEDFEGKKKLFRYSKIYIQSAKLINHSARTNWEIQNLRRPLEGLMACSSRHLFVWRLHNFARAFVELIWFQFHNLFFPFFCSRNSPRTKRTLMLVSCQSRVTWLYVYFARLYFGKRKWKFEFEKDRYVCWWPTIQNNLNGSYHPFVKEALARFLLLDDRSLWTHILSTICD